jgi:D-alanine-D-alanine ligase
MITPDPDWWKTLFDETYLVTDARSVCDPGLTSKEVDFLEETLKLEKSWPILDLCGGQGRHSLELSRRGFQDLTVLDFSKVLIDLGKKMAQKEDLNTLFIWKDARDTGLPRHSFKAIIIMASSFGYFLDDRENKNILREASRVLIPQGSLLLDLPNREFVMHNFAPQSWHEANQDVVVCRQRRRDEDILYCREIVISRMKGMIRDATYCTRLYSAEKITEMLTSVGFSSVEIETNFASHGQKGDYGILTNRMIVTARKR